MAMGWERSPHPRLSAKHTGGGAGACSGILGGTVGNWLGLAIGSPEAQNAQDWHSLKTLQLLLAEQHQGGCGACVSEEGCLCGQGRGCRAPALVQQKQGSLRQCLGVGGPCQNSREGPAPQERGAVGNRSMGLLLWQVFSWKLFASRRLVRDRSLAQRFACLYTPLDHGQGHVQSSATPKELLSCSRPLWGGGKCSRQLLAEPCPHPGFS